MSNSEIKHLFRLNRLPDSDKKLCFLVLYFPLGLFLLVLRTVLIIGLFLLGSLLSDTLLIQKFLNKLACLSLGILVTVENQDKKENVDVFVSNSVSIFDHLAVQTATGSVTPGLKNSLVKSKGFGARYFGTQSNLESFKKNVAQWIAEYKVPVNFSPEGKITNGKALLKFKTLPFQIASKVQPVGITIDRPLLNISVNTLGSNNFIDMLFYMFSPFTNYRIKFLPALENKSHTHAEFADIVRHSIADGLKAETPNLVAADLIEYEKRIIAEEQANSQNQSRMAAQNPEFQRMSLQVKEVLPHVPLKAIYNDLCITKSIDATITNILEGRVHFVPEQVAPSTSSTGASTSEAAAKSSQAPVYTPEPSGNRVVFNTAASSFPKSASERSKSFHERKQQLIAASRQRYIEKHNLDIPF